MNYYHGSSLWSFSKREVSGARRLGGDLLLEDSFFKISRCPEGWHAQIEKSTQIHFFRAMFATFSYNVDENLSEYHHTSPKMQKYIEIWTKFANSCETFPEFSWICEIAEIIHFQIKKSTQFSFSKMNNSFASIRLLRRGPPPRPETSMGGHGDRAEYKPNFGLTFR